MKLNAEMELVDKLYAKIATLEHKLALAEKVVEAAKAVYQTQAVGNLPVPLSTLGLALKTYEAANESNP